MGKLSVIIPSRNCIFASRTVEDIIEKATGDIEIIILLDGYWANPPIKPHKNVTVVHLGNSKGMRENINRAVRIAKGDYIMKSDDHCMFGKGFDEILQADCEENWICIPSRYSMDAEKWKRTRGPVDYQYLTFPYYNDETYGTGFHGKKWRGKMGYEGGFWHREKERKHIKIDDIICFQGSCWFMPKQHFYNIDCMDAKNYKFHQESIELAFKTWLSGGRVVRNKNTWYAHMHKSQKTGGRGYYISKKRMVDSELFSTDFWMNNRWPKQIHKFEWLVKKFGMADWPEDWNDPKWQKEWEHPWIKKKRLKNK